MEQDELLLRISQTALEAVGLPAMIGTILSDYKITAKLGDDLDAAKSAIVVVENWLAEFE